MFSKWHELMFWKFKNQEHQEWPGQKRRFNSNQRKDAKKLKTENWIQKFNSASASDWSKWYVVLLLIDARIISRIIVDGRWIGVKPISHFVLAMIVPACLTFLSDDDDDDDVEDDVDGDDFTWQWPHACTHPPCTRARSRGVQSPAGGIWEMCQIGK